MQEQPTPAEDDPHCAPTLDMPQEHAASAESTGESTAVSTGHRMPVAVVQDDDTGMTQETLTLLWRRLWLATLVLFVSFSVFLIRHMLIAKWDEPGTTFLFGLHVHHR